MPRLVLCYPLEECHLSQIEDAAPGYEVIDAGQERVADEIMTADLFCGHPKVPVDWDKVARHGRLRWIQSSAAGLDHLLVPSVIESEIIITSASGVLAEQVSEHCVALTTAWLRRLPRFWQAQSEREFVRRPTLDLHHKKVGIVGMGGVGKRIAEVFRVFKTYILGADLYPECCPKSLDEVYHADDLDQMLPKVDILILSAPLTSRSRGMIDAARLARLRPHALLVNMGRGPLVVEKDLIAALQGGRLAGACLDVTETEPLSPESPLWGMPNVIITPHVAGQCEHRASQITDFFCTNLDRYFRGIPLKNLVDKRLGFPVPSSEA